MRHHACEPCEEDATLITASSASDASPNRAVVIAARGDALRGDAACGGYPATTSRAKLQAHPLPVHAKQAAVRPLSTCSEQTLSGLLLLCRVTGHHHFPFVAPAEPARRLRGAKTELSAKEQEQEASADEQSVTVGIAADEW